LLEGVAAYGDGVAEGGAVGEVAVFGLGCCWGLLAAVLGFLFPFLVLLVLVW
jgi:hypothetical protein